MPLTSPKWQHFAQIIHAQEPTQPEPAEYEFKIADTGQELLQAFGLLYHEYLHAGYISESPSELLFTRHHLLPETTVFVAKAHGRVLSTTSVVRDNREFGLPMDELYKTELAALRNERRRVLEICSLASDRHAVSRSAIQNFIKLIFLYCIFQDVDDVCIMVNPRHVRLYASLFGFKLFGEQKHYPKVNAPAVALRVKTVEARENLGRNCFTFSYSEHLHSRFLALKIALSDTILGAFQDNDNCAQNPLDACLIGHMLSVKDEILQDLTLECRELLQNCYPGLCIGTS
jgi:hypothetical protein